MDRQIQIEVENLLSWDPANLSLSKRRFKFRVLVFSDLG
jgi:hypothetical protein